jgi:hypothetical protein
MRLSVLLFVATEWLKKFERIGIASLNPLARRTIDLTRGHSTTLNRDPTASSRFIQ